MNDAENYWREQAEKLRRFEGLCPMTPQEAEEALKKIPSRKSSEDEIDAIVNAIASGELPQADDPPVVDWSPEYDYATIDSDAVLFRNEGDADEATDQLEDELLQELLDDDEPKNDADGLES